MASRATLPFYIDQATVGVVWLSKTKVFLVEQHISNENGFTYYYVPWLSNDGGKTFSRVLTPYGTGVVTGAGSLYRRNLGPNLWVDDKQNVYMMAMDFGGLGNNVFFYWQKLDGDNWQAIDGNRVSNPNGAAVETTHFFWDGDGKMFQAFIRNAGDNGDVIIYEHPGMSKATRVDSNWNKYSLTWTEFTTSQRSQRCMYAAPVNGRAMVFYGWADKTGGSLYLKVAKHNGAVWQDITSTGSIATFAKGANGNFLDILHGAVRNDGTVVVAGADNPGERVVIAIYDTITATWRDMDTATTGVQPIKEIYRNTQVVAGNTPTYGIGGPFVMTDGSNTIIAYITRSNPATGTKVWTVRSRRLLLDGTLEAEITYETFNDHTYMQTYGQYPAVQGPGGGRVFGPWQSQSKIYDRGAIIYPHTDFAQGMHQFQTFDNNLPSLQSTITSLTGAKTTSVLTPTGTWQFNDSNLDDLQTAFQVEVWRQDTGAVIYTSAKIISALGTYQIPAAAGLAYNKFYQWRVRTYDTANTVGAWSELHLFKTTQSPTGTMTLPLNTGTLPTDTPTFAWTYSQTAGVPQTHFNVNIYNQTSGVLIYESSWMSSTNGYYDIPPGTMENGGTYSANVKLRSQEGAEGITNTVNFDVQFIAPPTPAIVVQQDRLGSYNKIIITQTMPANDSLSADTMRIYRAESGSAEGYKLLSDNIPVPARAIDNFENPALWLPVTGSPTPSSSTNSKEGVNSVNFGSSAAQAQATWNYDNYPVNGLNSGDYSNYDKIHVWVYLAAGTKEKVGLLRFKLGKDASNYYRFDQNISSMTNGAWNLLNIPFNTAIVIGSPNLSALSYVQAQIDVATTAQAAGIPLGDIKLDQMRLLKDNLTVDDYELGNDKTYTYRVVTVNSQQKLESRAAISNAMTTSFPDQMPDLINTYLTPVGNEIRQVGSWQDAKSNGGNWKRVVDTEYYKPLNRRQPVVYKSGLESYRTGAVTLTFFDTNLAAIGSGLGITGARQIEDLLAEYPLLLRTWWGDVIQVSIDGEANISRLKGRAWIVSFNWTETGV